jgi:hypothetical protein
MDRRSKHLSSEEHGVIFAEHGQGSSLRVITITGHHINSFTNRSSAIFDTTKR